VPLRDLPRASGFRLGLFFLALVLAAYLILFGFIYWRTAGYLHGEVDVWLKREMAARIASGEAALRQAVEDHLRLDPAGRRPFVLFDAEGHWLAGNPASLPAPLRRLDRPFNFTLPRDNAPEPFRGIVHRLASGDIFLVAQDMRDIHEFRDLLLGAMVSGAALVLVIGLGGAGAVGAGAVSRIDAVTRAIERIVTGDLSERLPGGGTGGDLARLILVVNRMLDQIERLMREVKGVTEDIAHDLRTPLTRLLAGLERTRRRATTADAYAITVDEAIAETKGILATFSALLRIAETERAAVLRRFYRAEKSRHEQGSGLGLSLVAAVARLHGLQLAIEDAMPGCRVTLRGDGVALRSAGQQIQIAEGA